MPSHPNTTQAIRDLRLQIARQRRRIDRQARSVYRTGAQLLSWRTWLRRVPASLLAGLSERVGQGRWPSESYLRLVRRMVAFVVRRLAALLTRSFKRRAPETTADAAPAGGDHA